MVSCSASVTHPGRRAGRCHAALSGWSSARQIEGNDLPGIRRSRPGPVGGEEGGDLLQASEDGDRDGIVEERYSIERSADQLLAIFEAARSGEAACLQL